MTDNTPRNTMTTDTYYSNGNEVQLFEQAFSSGCR